MKIFTLAVLATLTLPVHALSLGSLIGSDDETETTETETSSLLDQGLSQLTGSSESNPLVSLLSEQVGVSSTDAASGAGALLALAGNSLSGDESSELANLIPGMDSLTSSVPGLSSMLEGAESLSSVMSIFETLGIDPSLVTQYAPVMLSYLSDSGASSGSMSSLTSLWSE